MHIVHRINNIQLIFLFLRGKLAKGVSGKDVILALCGSFKDDEVLNCAVEFVGEVIFFLILICIYFLIAFFFVDSNRELGICQSKKGLPLLI